MSTSTHIVGYKVADKQWKKMKSVWDSCIAADIEPPDKVVDFFDGEYPEDAPGKVVEIEGYAVKKFNKDGEEGYEVDISALPEGVRFVRFFCCW